MSSLLNNANVGFIKLKYYLIMLVITITAIALNAVPPGWLGGFLVCTILGMGLIAIGDVCPIIKDFFGGGAFLAIFGGAALIYFNVIPAGTVKIIDNLIRPMDYIGWAVMGLICGSILTMNRKLLIRAGMLYLLPLLAGILFAFIFAGLIGAISGFGWKQAIMFIALPIMGGGTSAGAVPTSQLYGAALSRDSGYYLSLLMPAVVMGNVLAIVGGGLLDRLGKAIPSLTGNGVLMKGVDLSEGKLESEPLQFEHLGTGFILSGVFAALGVIVAKFVPAIHYYAWTIVIVAIVKIVGLFPKAMEAQMAQWYDFILKITLPAVMFGIGCVYTDLAVVKESFSLFYFVIVLVTVIGALLGTAIFGKLVGFYPIESMITAGLCMSNMGGTGDVATLGAAKRMSLMPFAQISSRIGGAIVIIIASILTAVLGKGL
ncbi:2-hydroxycarboxylate transporter family protein [Treponema primitia]|uniref:2-hydroxycarboxylate transporter family protein n=1 Tax=Treponema primitia TaxID=88058 RepID=UPI0039803FCC